MQDSCFSAFYIMEYRAKMPSDTKRCRKDSHIETKNQNKIKFHKTKITKDKNINLVKYFETMNIETIILGCTHFPYIKEELEKITDLEIIDPGIKMVQKI